MDTHEKIIHFGARIKKCDDNKISRANYAVIDKRNSLWTSKTPLRYSSLEQRQAYYDDEECRIYSDSFCLEWQEKCLINYDKNMVFYSQLSKSEFEEMVKKEIESFPNVRKVLDVNNYSGVQGVYLLLLDEYKQVYVGQSKDIKKRILAHWSKRKEFDRLIFGSVNNSSLSIDSFGALDTTRIYAIETDLLDNTETAIISKIPLYFRLNRIGGGAPKDNLDIMISLGEWNLRSLKDCHNEEFAEKREELIDVTYFVPQKWYRSKKISTGDIICVEQNESGVKRPVKYYGKVIKIDRNGLAIFPFCGPILENSCYSSKCKVKEGREALLYMHVFEFGKNAKFKKVDMIQKSEVHAFWRSKKYPHLEA